MAEQKAVVLLSGGLDSVTTLAWAKHKNYRCWALSFLYGQRHSVELACARYQAQQMEVETHQVLNINFDFGKNSTLTQAQAKLPAARSDPANSDEIPSTYVPARNTIFLSYALAWAEILQAEAIFLGANAVDYSGYPDCRPEFLQAFEAMAKLATARGVKTGYPRIEAPLINLKKAEIISLSLSLGVDLSETTSCYDPSPNGQACLNCESCHLRARGFAALGRPDPRLEKSFE